MYINIHGDTGKYINRLIFHGIQHKLASGNLYINITITGLETLKILPFSFLKTVKSFQTSV